MLADLPPPLHGYFEASSRHDPDALASLFADGATVRDEGEEMVGAAAIRDWAEATFRKYRATLTPVAVEEREGATLVKVEVTGSFPGSPIRLGFRFQIAAGKITDIPTSVIAN